MPQSFSQELLSGSTHGAGIQVTGTNSGAAVTVHTAVASTTSFDMVSLYAVNNDADSETRTLTIQWAGTTAVVNEIIAPVPAKQAPVLVARFPIRNTLLVKAFADEANDVVIYGEVQRVTVT